MAATLPTDYVSETFLNECVGLEPSECFGDMRSKAREKLMEQLKKRNDILNVLSVTLKDRPLVVPGKGTVNYEFNVLVQLFEPRVGGILSAMVSDVSRVCVTLQIAHMLCFLPIENVYENGGTVNVAHKDFEVGDRQYTIGSTLSVKVLSMKNDIYQSKAIVSLV